MCLCKGKKGDQGVQGIKGDTGDTGATGPVFSLTRANLSVQAITDGATDPIIASAAATGTLYFWGSVSLTGNLVTGNAVNCTITPKINGVAVTASIAVSSLHTKATISIAGAAAISITDDFELLFNLSAGGHTVSEDSGCILYYIA